MKQVVNLSCLNLFFVFVLDLRTCDKSESSDRDRADSSRQESRSNLNETQSRSNSNETPSMRRERKDSGPYLPMDGGEL